MALRVAAASNEELTLASAPVTAPPFSVSIWFHALSVQNAFLWGVGDTTSTQRHYLEIEDAGGSTRLHAGSKDGVGGSDAITSTEYSANVYQHAMRIWESTTDRTAWLNGGGKVQDTTSKAPSGIDRMRVGVDPDQTAGKWYDGYVGWLVIWNVAIAENFVQMLAAGASPMGIVPESIVAAYPIYSNKTDGAVDVSGNGLDMGVAGTPVAAPGPPTLITPWRDEVLWTPAGAGAAPPAGFIHSQAVVMA